MRRMTIFPSRISVTLAAALVLGAAAARAQDTTKVPAKKDTLSVPVQPVPVQPVPAESVPVQPVPVQPVPTESVPVQPVPVEPVPAESVPVQPVPIEPAPAESVPVEPVPVEPAPAESLPVQPVPVEPAPAESLPVQPVPVEPVPAEPVPTEPVPAQPVPVEPVPAQPVPVEPVPAEPVPTEPVPAQPVPAQPVPVEPAPAQPVPAEPAPAQPVPAEPVPAQPEPAQPVPAQPEPAQPVPAEPVPAQPEPAQPVPAEPVPAEPVPAQPEPAQPVPAQPVAAQPAPPPPGGQVHIVEQGETLWGLSQQFLGDPLLWPEIYRLNTAMIQDPHWIFPGEQLVLGGMPAALAGGQGAVDTSAQAPAVVGGAAQAVAQPPGVQPPSVAAPVPPPPPPPAGTSAPTIFARRRASSAGSVVVGEIGGDVYRYRPVRRGEFYSAGFLTEDTSFPWGKVIGDPHEPAFARNPETSTVEIYQEVELRAPGEATYQPGDSLLVARLGRQVSGWGNVVVPSGIVRVIHTRGRDVLAEVVQQFNRIVDGQVTIPLEPFHNPGMVTPVSVENGLESRVITVRDLHAVQNQQNIVFIDAGRDQGVALGDLFEVRQTVSAAPTGVQQRVALLQIVHVRDRSASGLILQIYQPGLQAGQPAQLIRKMPS